MTDIGPLVEQRKHPRYRGVEHAIARVVPPRCCGSLLGQIMDISITGLAFRHGASNEPTNASSELDIYMQDTDFYLDSLPFKTIYDFEIGKDSLSNPLPMRQRGVQFTDLRSDQLSQLEYFIWHYTKG
jgi:hypothetical protein